MLGGMFLIAGSLRWDRSNMGNIARLSESNVA
jgi:hypothetical protein